MSSDNNVVLMAEAAEALREEFLHWQCRIRQMAMREQAGRPSRGMRPTVLSQQGEELSAGIVVLIHKEDSKESTAFFRHQMLQTQDPVERWEKAIDYLAATYFQRHREFSDTLTALFGPGPGLPDRLLDHRHLILEFYEFSRRYRIPCTVEELSETDPVFQGTYWHNRLFNPNLPAGIRILAFQPDWPHAAVSDEEEESGTESDRRDDEH